MLKLVSLAAFGLAFDGEEDGWTDNFGWSCRDYGRAPEQCDSSMGRSSGASSSCFICFERRRQTKQCSDCLPEYNSCTTTNMGICDTQYDACTRNCGNAVVPNPAPSPEPTREPDTSGGMAWWIPVLIGAISLCLLCLLCGILYMFCRPAEVGDCSQAADAQPMIIQAPASAPCDTGECETGCEQPMPLPYPEAAGSCGREQYYSPQAYPQQGGCGQDGGYGYRQ